MPFQSIIANGECERKLTARFFAPSYKVCQFTIVHVCTEIVKELKGATEIRSALAGEDRSDRHTKPMPWANCIKFSYSLNIGHSANCLSGTLAITSQVQVECWRIILPARCQHPM